jgi:hypothetical protein
VSHVARVAAVVAKSSRGNPLSKCLQIKVPFDRGHDLPLYAICVCLEFLSSTSVCCKCLFHRGGIALRNPYLILLTVSSIDDRKDGRVMQRECKKDAETQQVRTDF